VGGSSAEAYRVGGSLADVFGLWGEPLKETKEQIDKICAFFPMKYLEVKLRKNKY